MNLLHAKGIAYVISAWLTQTLQQAMVSQCKFWLVEPGLEMGEISYQAHGWKEARRIVVVRQSIKVRAQAPGKMLHLFADDPDIQGWRYGAMVASLELPALQIWRLYRGRADCENRIKELKADFGPDSFNMTEFWATEAALGMAISTLVSTTELVPSDRYEIRRTSHAGDTASQGICGWCFPGWRQRKNVLRLAIARRRRQWFEGLWAQAASDLGLHRFGHE